MVKRSYPKLCKSSMITLSCYALYLSHSKLTQNGMYYFNEKE